MRLVSGRVTRPLQALQPDLLHQQPEEVLVREPLLVTEALVREVGVDLGAVLGVGVEPFLALALRPLAGRADVHHHLRTVDLLGQREGSCVERVGELLVVLGDHPRAAAGSTVQLDELDVQQRRHLRHRAVQLRGEATADASGPVGDLHRFAPTSGPVAASSSSAASATTTSGGSSSSSPTMYRFSSMRSGRPSTVS